MILGAVTIMGVLCYWLFPEERWLPREAIIKALNAADGANDGIDE